MVGSHPRFAVRAVGAVRYDPRRADPEAGWGPYEVHPQLVPAEVEGAARLRSSGEWLVVPPEGESLIVAGIALRYVCVRELGAAERIAAALNGDRPTRVVLLDGTERASAHSTDSFAAEVAARATE